MGIWKDTLGQEMNLIGIRKKGKSVKQSTHQTGTSYKKLDMPRKALPPGKRISKYGNVYYEYRKNRSDLNGGV